MELHWKDALGTHARDLRMRALSPRLLSEEGEVIETKGGDKILLDKDFAYYATAERIFRPLGLIAHDKVKKDYITKVFIPECITFAEKEGAKFAASKLVRLAQAMSQVNKLSTEENIKFLLSSRNIVSDDDDDFNLYDEESELVRVF